MPVVCTLLSASYNLMANLPVRAHAQVSATEIQRTVAMMKEVLEEAGLRPLGVPRPAPAPAVEVRVSHGVACRLRGRLGGGRALFRSRVV